MATQAREGAGRSVARKITKVVDRHVFKYAEIKMNQSRKCPCVRYRDADGMLRYHGVPMPTFDERDPEARREALDAVSETLHTFYLENNNLANGCLPSDGGPLDDSPSDAEAAVDGDSPTHDGAGLEGCCDAST